MAVLRERPYGRFNFLVDFGNGSDSFEAGFQECSPISSSVTLYEYRNGNERNNATRKLPGLTKYDDVTLKRGVIGSLNLYDWYNQFRNGDVGAVRNVTISLQNEDHTATVMTWKLFNAMPVKYSAGPLNGKGTDVAVEELTLAYERLEIE
jgi:phage tail-like protein